MFNTLPDDEITSTDITKSPTVKDKPPLINTPNITATPTQVVLTNDSTTTPMKNDANTVPGKAFDKQLIYHIDKATKLRRLCIPKAIVKDILNVAHTLEEHLRFARCYERISSS